MSSPEEIADGQARWQARYDEALAAGGVRDADFTTLSGEDVQPLYGPRPGNFGGRLRADRVAGGVPVHAGVACDGLSGPAVDDPAVAELGVRRSGRVQADVDRALVHMLAAVRADRNAIPPVLDACRAEATLGEICDALRAEWGEHRETARF